MNNPTVKTIDALTEGDELENVLKSGCEFPLRVTGHSMRPFLKEKRDTVWLISCDSPKIGQIVLFRRSDGHFVLHRVRKIRKDGSLTVNGDAQTWTETIRKDQVIARVTAVARDGKRKSCGSFSVRLRDALWYPTRPIRPFIFKAYSLIRKVIKK